MREAEFANKNLILKVQTGSHLYGTNTESSDVDSVGICIPPEDYVIGLYAFDQYQENSKSSGADRRNTAEDYDCTIYSIKKYILLAKDNNPNILEILFAPKQNILFSNEFGDELLKNNHLFPSQKAYYTFCGYAHSQKNKLISKRIRLKSFQDSLFFLEMLKQRGQENLSEKLEIRGAAGEDRIWKTYEKNSKVSEVELDIVNLIEEYGSRTEYIKKYGYDIKFASHLIRLLFLAEELLLTGQMSFPLRNASTVLDIKSGKWNLDNVLRLADDLEKDVELAKEKTILPHTVNLETINSLLVSLTKKFWKSSIL